MAARKRENEKVNIHAIANNGFSVGRNKEGMVVFVDGGVPGDEVDVEFFSKKKGSWFGKINQLIKPSIHRKDPHCRHFGVCGGCSWQHIEYAEQLHQKEKWVRDAIQRIAKIPDAVFEPIIPARETSYYRNKLEYTFSTYRWKLFNEVEQADEHNKALGFHRPGHFQKIVDIHHCYHQGGISNDIRNFIRTYTIEQGWDYYDIKNHTGLMRNLTLRSNKLDEFMCILCFGRDDQDKIQQLSNELIKAFPQIKSIYTSVNTKYNDSIYDLDLKLFAGIPFLTETWDHVQFLIGPKSFFQTNPKQAQVLFQLIEGYCELKGDETILDLYCGVGSIGIYLAHKAAKLIGVETIQAAVDDARKNALANHLENCEFHTAMAESLELSAWILERARPDIVIVDPPRMGLHEKVCQELIKMQIGKLIYVSCNPSTQARDIDRLSEKYKVIKLRPVDMFPHTNHVECVALLSLRT